MFDFGLKLSKPRLDAELVHPSCPPPPLPSLNLCGMREGREEEAPTALLFAAQALFRAIKQSQADGLWSLFMICPSGGSGPRTKKCGILWTEGELRVVTAKSVESSNLINDALWGFQGRLGGFWALMQSVPADQHYLQEQEFQRDRARQSTTEHDTTRALATQSCKRQSCFAP